MTIKDTDCTVVVLEKYYIFEYKPARLQEIIEYAKNIDGRYVQKHEI